VHPRPYSRPSLLVLALCVGAMLSFGCGPTGSYVWVSDYREPAMPMDKNTVLVPGDVITVRVYQQPDMSTKTRVRSDGKVSMPLLNDVDAAGLTPAAFAQALQVRLKEFMNAPVVTISLDDPRPNSIPVTGEVSKPGVFQLEPGAGVLTALASAGGLTPFATWSKVFVIRQGPVPVRIRFDYRELRDGERTSLQFQLRQGDAVVVE
jgi:polysaccharide export outer membrane protein